jgi:CubicO group peptidase (beta-lactamase class C family)/tetratricopeptide (TPR) repeat protein
MGSRTLRFFLSTVVLFALLPAAAQDNPYADAIAEFRGFVERQMQADRIPGLSVGFVKDGFTWAEGFGFADLENGVPAKAESAYRLASVTKPMTAIGVLALVEQGKIDLDAEVQAYVPYFPKKPWPVTVRDVLGHLGGISHYRNYDLEGHSKDHKDTREAIAVFEEFDLVAEPRERFNYSSYGYNLLGAVIEGASGKSYGEHMREVLWGPLGMDDTRMDDPYEIIPNRVRGYRQGPGGSIIHSEFVDISSRFAAGGTRSTVVDLLKLGRGLIDGKVLSRESMDTMLTSMATREGRFTDYGMGWTVSSVNGRFFAAHSGGQAETRTYFIWYPGIRFAVAIACNFEGADRQPYIRELYRLIVGEAYQPATYTGSAEDDAVLEAMRRVFRAGASRFDRDGEALTEDRERLERAFAWFDDCVNPKKLAADLEAAREKIAAGRHPVADRAFEVMGSYMAARIARDRSLDALHGGGEIPFFQAWVEVARTDKSIPRPLRPDKRLARRIAAWNTDWKHTWSADVQALSISESSNIEQVAAALRASFEGASVYPRFDEELEELTGAYAVKGNLPGASRAAMLSLELYPKSDRANLTAGLVKLAGRDRDAAAELIRTSQALDPEGAASAGSLNGWAYRLQGIGQAELGVALLEIANEMYPDSANLHDSRGELLLGLGQRDAAIAAYEKALEVDPDFEHARRMLAEIRGDSNP